ncbi:NfeD family protein [Amycolatopsis sp. NPDC059657]|uniref:NfeD family protein n=1 Tax=Amycolatopsis sp. NPDC059657 TaxID=3346899 RepID=UPI00366ADDD6
MNTDTYRPARKGTGATGILLWLTLAIAAIVNMLSSFAGLNVIVQVAAGAVVLVCALLLTERYRRRRAAKNG